jgi:uncharacterized membrane protein
MKNDYLKELRGLLNLYRMDDSEKEDIINDYSEMYDNWIDSGMSEDQVESKLGKPKSIISDLVEGYRKVISSAKANKGNSAKIIALSPFIATIIFLVIGFGYEGWIYGWMVFLIIPITAIVVELGRSKDPHIFTALSPFLSVIVFFVLGFGYDLWHPGWMIFTIIPVIAIFTDHKSIGRLNTLVSLSPFISGIGFLVLGFQYDLWQPGWLIFLLIPALGVLNEKKFIKVLIWETVIIGGAIAYLYIGYTFDEWVYSLLVFLPLIAYGMSQDDQGFRGMPKEYRIVVAITITLFVVLGLLTKEWGFVWLVFLIIPVFAINKEVEGNAKIISLMPFISLVIFFSLGWFLGLWAYSWAAFLLIPMVAIIKEA